ncbi:MAG: hypothetical protein U0Q18_31810 [Bryobacteraceae bacterium]
MKRKTYVVGLTAAVLAFAFVLLTVPGSRAEANGCKELRGITQAILPSPYPLASDGSDVWGGTVYVSLGGEYLIGIMAGNDGGKSQHGAKGGRYQVYLCNPAMRGALDYPPACPDSIIYEVPNSVFGFAPGKGGLGEYKGNTAQITSGTGRFAGASGNLNFSGPYILWPDSSSPFFGIYGRFNGEYSGSVCGVQ